MPKFYKPSNKLTLMALTLAPLGFAVSSSLSGIMYAVASWYSPLFVNPIICLGWLFLTSYLLYLVIQATKARYPLAVAVFAFVGVLVGYYVHWCVWLTLVVEPAGAGVDGLAGLETPSGPEVVLSYILNPKETFHLVLDIRQVGVRSLWIVEWVPSGFLLTCFWFLEFLVYVCFTVMSGYFLSARPFSEVHDGWYHPVKFRRDIFKAPELLEDCDQAARMIMDGDLRYFLDAPFVTRERVNCFKLTLYNFPSAPAVGYATVLASITTKKKGQRYYNRALVVNVEVPGKLTRALMGRMR
ncbi:MAG: hypothetical protein LBF41_05595 [Deltaproteobacteria bacterium]|nr:hypothetical protein [Deltaproteobacteria bacterium]